MKVAPFRALTQNPCRCSHRLISCRNEGRPFQGIDTRSDRSRPLCLHNSRNEGRPFQGLNTKSGSAVVFYTTAKPLFFSASIFPLSVSGFPAFQPLDHKPSHNFRHNTRHLTFLFSQTFFRSIFP